MLINSADVFARVHTPRVSTPDRWISGLTRRKYRPSPVRAKTLARWDNIIPGVLGQGAYRLSSAKNTRESALLYHVPLSPTLDFVGFKCRVSEVSRIYTRAFFSPSIAPFYFHLNSSPSSARRIGSLMANREEKEKGRNWKALGILQLAIKTSRGTLKICLSLDWTPN